MVLAHWGLGSVWLGAWSFPLIFSVDIFRALRRWCLAWSFPLIFSIGAWLRVAWCLAAWCLGGGACCLRTWCLVLGVSRWPGRALSFPDNIVRPHCSISIFPNNNLARSWYFPAASGDLNISQQQHLPILIFPSNLFRSSYFPTTFFDLNISQQHNCLF
jgi:hypothetical protein